MKRILVFAAILFMANSLFAGSVITQRVVRAQGFVKGSTTISLSGQLDQAFLDSLDAGSGMAIYNYLDSYLTFPTLLPKTKGGYGTKSKTQSISVSTKNGKFSWAEKDVTPYFAFASGFEKIAPTKATFKSSGTLQGGGLDDLGTKKFTVFDFPCDRHGFGYLGSLAFSPEKKGKNYKFTYKEDNWQVKFSANAKGKASASYKLPPDAATPAFVTEEYIFTNKYDYSFEQVGGGEVEYGFVGPDKVELKVTENNDKFRYFLFNGEKITNDYLLADLEQDSEFTAVFGNYDITVNVVGSGSVSYEFVGQDDVKLTAQDGDEMFYDFTWGDNVSRENPLTITMTSDTTVTATFKEAAFIVIDINGGTEAKSWPVSMTPYSPEVEKDACRTTEIWLKLIKPGSFNMGSPTNEVGRYEDEDQHAVNLTKNFALGIFEVTQIQFEIICGTNFSAYAGFDRPADMVSYDFLRGTSNIWTSPDAVDADSFIGVLRAKTGYNFDLPTEAQWEFACRAGTTNALYTGQEITENVRCTNVALMCRYRYNREDGKGGYTEHTRVGSYDPNPWGFYDMCGNVWEWTRDFYGAYPTVETTDPIGPGTGSKRILRGGSWAASAQNCRSARRRSYWPEASYDGGDSNFGFRLSITLD
ncbi:formylglycine-generating enzyme family protein [bacterium]|nr:formylglycine-generating enzyme family protein [bacterium]